MRVRGFNKSKNGTSSIINVMNALKTITLKSLKTISLIEPQRVPRMTVEMLSLLRLSTGMAGLCLMTRKTLLQYIKILTKKNDLELRSKLLSMGRDTKSSIIELPVQLTLTDE